jgi:steroid 5-alpha reductase family enzyme
VDFFSGVDLSCESVAFFSFTEFGKSVDRIEHWSVVFCFVSFVCSSLFDSKAFSVIYIVIFHESMTWCCRLLIVVYERRWDELCYTYRYAYIIYP